MKTKTMTKPQLLTIIVIVFVSVMGKYLWRQADDEAEAARGTLIRRTSEHLNLDLPMMVDAVTRLDRTYGSHSTIIFYYTLIEVSVDALDIDSFIQETRPVILNDYCNPDWMKGLRANNVPIFLEYRDKDGKQIASFTAKPTDCESST